MLSKPVSIITLGMNAYFKKPRPDAWRLKDLIDLEYFLKQDAGGKSQAPVTVHPDRERFLAYSRTHTPPYSRRELILFWLSGRREDDIKTNGGLSRLPGDGFAEAYRLATALLLVISLASGWAIAWPLLSYQGVAPINIFTLLWVFLLPQAVLLLMLGLVVFLRKTGLMSPIQSVYPLLTALIRRTALRLKSAALRSLPPDKLAPFQSAQGLIGRQSALYGAAFQWPVFVLAQTVMLGYNIGLLTATLVKLSITDLAFGWQSTLVSDPALVHRIISAFATPWSFMPSAFPSLSQVAGSKIILKEGAARLATGDLVSWWPFLCFSLLFYGLLPRLALLLVGILCRERAMRRIDFSSSECDRLMQRMLAPVMAAEARPYIPLQTPPATQSAEDRIPPPIEEPGGGALGKALALIPEDMAGRCPPDAFKDRIQEVLGLEMARWMACEMDADVDMAKVGTALSEMVEAGHEPSALRILVLQEAWQPPIRETLSWLTALRRTIGNTTGVIIGLVGKPAANAALTSPDDTSRMIWEQAANRLGDPFLRTEPLGG